MATSMTAAQVVAQLKKWGLRYVEIPGWATHNREGHGAWGPVNGFVWHHTGADVTDGKAYAASTLYNGIAGLPGPLCHFSIGTDGTVYLVGWGRANHAGGGDPAVLAHVQAEDYTGQLHPTRGNSNGVDGNAHFYGVEIQYSGSHEMSPAQYTAARKLSAAILDFHGWSERSVIGHGEWSSDKWDPGYAPGKIMAMPTVRADVKTTLAAGPGGTPPSQPNTGGGTSPSKATPMTLSDVVVVGAWLKAQWPDDKGLADGKITVNTAIGSAYGHARAAHEGVDALRKEVADLRAAVAKLTAAVAAKGA
ncbi:peptidoglycan recognition protein family protein [Streptomyces capoamus]|uniref:peptidoglycan recognition protein family protein n=1 Tax=Streptomyces capoamus TaxID=68183 RepID=UPI00339498C0